MRFPDDLQANVLAAGYALHEKPFHMAEREGLPSFLFRLQTQGRASALVHGELTPVAAGDLLLYRPGDPYELRFDPTTTEHKHPSFDYFLFCEGSWLEAWWAQGTKRTLNRVPMEDSIVPVWRQIITDRKMAAFRTHDSLVSDYLLRSLCLIIDSVTAEWHGAAHGGSAFIAHRMKTFIEQRVIGFFWVEDVADHVGLSVSRTVHLFKQTFGQTLMGYALDVRLNMACERIRFGSMSLEQAAISAGFRSYSYFHRVFKARFGVSPKAYRIM